MIKLNLTNSMIGNYYPFFLSNQELGDTHYMYEIVSPGLNNSCIPYISLKKVSEKTKSEPYGRDMDILSICIGNKKNIENTSVEFLNELLKKEEPVIKSAGNKNFPLIEMVNGNNLQKSIIVSLRDSLRWKLYKFMPGRYIDVLWTPTQFVVFKLVGDGDNISLTPVNAYNNLDISMVNPLKVDLSNLDYPKDVWSGKNRASDINRVIKKLEWESFNREELK